MKAVGIRLFSVCILSVFLLGDAKSVQDTEDRIALSAIAGIVSSVAQPIADVISSGGGDGSHSTWEMKDGSGVRIDANNCWQDGGGACPNGNCMDSKGPRGIMIKETTVSCKWFCDWRAHCKTQICCPQVRSMEFRSVDSSNEEKSEETSEEASLSTESMESSESMEASESKESSESMEASESMESSEYTEESLESMGESMESSESSE